LEVKIRVLSDPVIKQDKQKPLSHVKKQDAHQIQDEQEFLKSCWFQPDQQLIDWKAQVFLPVFVVEQCNTTRLLKISYRVDLHILKTDCRAAHTKRT